MSAQIRLVLTGVALLLAALMWLGGGRCGLDFSGALFFEAVGKLFDHGVGQHVAGDPFDFSPCIGCLHGAQGELEVLTLPHVLDGGVLHSFQRAMDGLPLRVEDGALQRDVDMRLHSGRL
jgi:hypothetical protein